MVSTARSYSVTRSAPEEISFGFCSRRIEKLHTIQFRAGVTSAWEGIRDDIPSLKGQRHQEIMNLFEVRGGHVCGEGGEGRASKSSPPDYTRDERGTAGGFPDLRRSATQPLEPDGDVQ